MPSPGLGSRGGSGDLVWVCLGFVGCANLSGAEPDCSTSSILPFGHWQSSGCSGGGIFSLDLQVFHLYLPPT